MAPPNVIVFLTDQQRWDSTGVHGNPLGLTPNFDRVAQEGTFLAHSYSVQPLCGPSRACLQTSRYATQSGVYRNDIPLPKNAETLAEQFKRQGYRTGYIGKWHLASEEPVPPDERGGYEAWLAANWLEFSSGAYDTVVYDEASRERKLPGYRVDALTDAAIRFVAEQEQPFFLFVSLLEPHQQNQVDDYLAPIGYREQFHGAWLPPDLQTLPSQLNSTGRHIAGYYGMVKRVDEAFGRLLDALESLALSSSTIVAFSSDHGCHFRTRNEEYKRSCHDASLRVPTALTGPGFTGGGRVQMLTTLLDLAPTLLGASGIPIPDIFEGMSVLPLLRGAADWRSEVFFQISESEVGRGIRTQRWKYSVTAPDHDGFKDAASDSYLETHLYDLKHDPYELHNLVALASHSEVRAHLRRILKGYIREVEGLDCTISEPAQRPSTYFDQRVVTADDLE